MRPPAEGPAWARAAGGKAAFRPVALDASVPNDNASEVTPMVLRMIVLTQEPTFLTNRSARIFVTTLPARSFSDSAASRLQGRGAGGVGFAQACESS